MCGFGKAQEGTGPAAALGFSLTQDLGQGFALVTSSLSDVVGMSLMCEPDLPHAGDPSVVLRWSWHCMCASRDGGTGCPSAGSTILGQSQGAVFPAFSKIPSLNRYLEKLLVLAVSSPLG